MRASFALRLAWWAYAPILAHAANLPNPDQLFSEVAQRNQTRDAELQKYSAVRTYEVASAAGRVLGESTVRVRYEYPQAKTFEILSEHGSRVVQAMVFRPLREHEAKTSEGSDKTGSAVTPANYRVEAAGEADLDGRHCYLLRAIPRRRDKYLFRGTLWIDAQDLAIARIEGEPAKLPSFWVRKVSFVRSYRKIGDFWLPSEDTSVSEVKIFGSHTLTIRYSDYTLDGKAPDVADEYSAAEHP
jgi:outer membrane lipoprotein-sorting protein